MDPILSKHMSTKLVNNSTPYAKISKTSSTTWIQTLSNWLHGIQATIRSICGFQQTVFFEILHPEMAISEKMEHTTAKSKYVGQCATQNSKAEESGQQGLQRQNKHAFVALNKEKLTESGRYLKRCFDNGDDVIALVAPMDTSNKTDVVRAETQMILYLQSFMTKTSKLENGNLSNESQAKQAIDYERTAQLLWQIVEKGSIYRLSKNPTDTNYAVRIDRKSLEFGEPPQPLPLSSVV